MTEPLCLRFRTSHPGWRPRKNHLHHWHRPHWSHGYRFCRHKHHTRAPHVRERSDPHRLPCAAHPDRDRPDDFKQEWKRREIWRKWVFTTRLTVEKLFCHSCRHSCRLRHWRLTAACLLLPQTNQLFPYHHRKTGPGPGLWAAVCPRHLHQSSCQPGTLWTQFPAAGQRGLPAGRYFHSYSNIFDSVGFDYSHCEILEWGNLITTSNE